MNNDKINELMATEVMGWKLTDPMPLLGQWYEDAQGEKVDVTDDPDFEVLSNFNEYQSNDQFWGNTTGYLELAGQVPWLLERDKSAFVTSMFPLCPANVHWCAR